MKGVRQGCVDARGMPQPYTLDSLGVGGVGGRETAIQPSGVGSQEVAEVLRENLGWPQRQGRRGPGSHRKLARGVMIQMLGLDPSQVWIYHLVTVARRQWSEQATHLIPKKRGKAQWRREEGKPETKAERWKVPQPTKGMVVVQGQEGMEKCHLTP